ncbi:carboxypeptidase-like regulatory domain-containing protein [Mucilaginibacter myungsuensis]|uniref:Carboxypeptidase-like regulatory domain-containing protein n=1 Tax=Mucilaginibacter myungsuensis TaxID=649104 RepID=A0A929PW59_9SPHI|nr:carboxypeptidase-like regulatory domain-containing protein [Mucilaginibacter myungsuensis]MBE9661819.1 carboxypeptidase-like regulatory domain-containing protein [Mucilaginibacter myungsuensis]MDN3599747.1 carboxypeptidase-like regulatory domain-containing protein [Mucilaginibacter myungsuensis]
MPALIHKHLIACIFALLLLPCVSSAQKIFEGQVLDKETEATIPGVTVILLKEKKGTQTNNRGYYKLLSTDTIATDTLQFTSVGYKTLKIAVSAYEPNMFVTLEVDVTQLKGVTITNSKKKIPQIHYFRMANIKTNDHNNPTLPFDAQYMFAVLAKAEKKHSRITSLKVGRRGFNDPNRPTGYAQFLLHILSVDATTGKPGQKIYTKQVIVEDNSMILDIDVSADNWVMDTDNFYIGVEWQRTPINERLVTGIDEIVWKTTAKGTQRLQDAPTYRMVYQPSLIAFINGKKYTAYYMNTPGNWQRYNLKISYMVMGTPVPYDTHIALSATLTY